MNQPDWRTLWELLREKFPKKIVFTSDDIAYILEVNSRTVRRWADEGKFSDEEAFKAGTQWRFRPSR